jgi:phosphate-selective porin OprO/OprP
MGGAEYSDLNGGGNGGDYKGLTYLTGVRVYF